jgi:hypothetical protein
VSTWTAPITFSSGTILTAAQLNAEIRDHANFLKGALDILTGSTTADTGQTMYMKIARPSSTDFAFRAFVGSEANDRLYVAAGGQIAAGAGGASAVDTFFERTTAAAWRVTSDLKARALYLDHASASFIELTENTTISAGAANTVRFYAQDNGAGKTTLRAVFATGAAQVLATEP